MNSYHFVHEFFNLTDYVQIDQVPVMTPFEFLYAEKVRNIKYFQVDTEGHDNLILKVLWKHLYHLPTEFYPNRIVFETNSLSTMGETMEVINLYTSIGYSVIQIGKHDSILQYRQLPFNNLIIDLVEKPPLDDKSIH